MNKKLPVIGLVMKSMEAEFFKEMKKGAIDYAKQRGDLELITVGTRSQTEVSRQIQLVEELIAQQVDAIVVIPIDSKALVATAIKAVRAGIEVINTDIMLDPEMLSEHHIELAFVGPDNEKAAKMVGDVLGKELGPGGKVVLIEGMPTAMNAQQRKKGFLDSITEHDLELLAAAVGNWETGQAAKAFSALLEHFPQIDGVMCANDAMALGVHSVLRKAGKSGEVKLVGFDNDPSAAALIRQGKMVATVDCFGSRMAAKGIDYAMRALSGDKQTGWIKTEMKLITSGKKER
ncbi:MAG: substrate-binding domain-containing protein [Bacteroidales bacterium]|nr:substrate-binding domain-containing protein [Bacteroidales bacterium]